ncbi:MAG: ribosome biogenesis GTP-binding protein YihA/YsxC [Chromatiales bacterium]|jgi:GTP-binding protein|nr:ribosome biogenesis GTP-binding protein YihA/YsxC [Chromatiales bacterium]MDX9768042.1 ribosome biogenesis GTP-binding protein YihA/YsxC [Ectothiorhodospiraceae bacterium]
MSLPYSRAAFLTSCADARKLPPDDGAEVAFAGRSNAGKSSAINALCGRKALARTSRTPGRTQLINFFTIDAVRRLVDLPGYGFAQAPETVRRAWGRLIEAYLKRRQSLRGLVLIMDIRHPLTDLDWQMLAWAEARGLPVHVLLSKADKLKRGPALETVRQVRKALEQMGVAVGVQAFSAHDGNGVDEARSALDAWLTSMAEGPADGPVDGQA